MKTVSTKTAAVLAGVVCGLVAVCLAFFGNPANMAICTACFIRDTAGALGFHTAAPVQYARPEIMGIILGAFVISFATKEFRSTAGQSPMLKFLLGVIMMIGSLVFLGCPLRMVIRMSAGDLNAWVGLIGFVFGVGTGAFFLKKGFSLGEAKETVKASGFVLPGLMLVLLLLAAFTTVLHASEAGPGSVHAPLLLSLAGGLIFGAAAQRSRMCFGGAVRNVILMKNFELMSVIGAMFVVLLIFNVATGRFHASFTTPGVIAHPQHLWNILGMYTVGFAAVLAGGCPLRQLILTGQGSSDSAAAVVGMFAGAALAHNFGLAASATAVNPETKQVVYGAVSSQGKIVLLVCIALCFVIAVVCRQKEKQS